MAINLFTTIWGLLKLIGGALFDGVKSLLSTLVLRLQDGIYVLLSAIVPRRPLGKVIPPGRPGHGGIWPEYIAPGPDDSRSPCPGINAMANHGILPRDGRHITAAMFTKAVAETYNFAPTLAKQITNVADFVIAEGRGHADLSDFNAQGAVQHDASFTRADIAIQVDQGVPNQEVIDKLLSRASDGNHLSLTDLAYEAGVRRTECFHTNGQYFLDFKHKLVGAVNAGFLYKVFGGKVDDLASWLKEERIPDGWEPTPRQRFGMPILTLDIAAFTIEFNTKAKQKLRPGDALMTHQVAPGNGSPYAKPYASSSA